jgi:hypothetical protein
MSDGDLSEDASRALDAFDRYGWASNTYIQRTKKLSRDQIIRATRELSEAGLVKRIRGRTVITAKGRQHELKAKHDRRLAGVRTGAANLQDVSLLRDTEVTNAVRRIKPRADREPDDERLLITFVDPGISEQLDSTNNQILYGRRGTGKTHVLRVLGDLLRAQPHNVVVYQDLRSLGSSAEFEDDQLPLAYRATSLIRTVFEPLHTLVLEAATQPGVSVDLAPFNAFADAVQRSVLTDRVTRVENSVDSDTTKSSKKGVGLTPSFVHADWEKGGTSKQHTSTAIDGRPLDSILFAEIASSLGGCLAQLDEAHLYLLLDEWTAIPEGLQPLLAEFLKRTLFVVPTVTVKIAALEYRSRFSEPLARNNQIGFEVGADVSSSLELDDYFVYDRNNARTEEVFAQVLYRHLTAEMTSLSTSVDDHGGYLGREYGVESADRLIELLFASRRPYRELVRAGEGVIRDFIGIFASAYFDAVRRGGRAIDLLAVRTAARNWFASDKEINVRRQHRDALDLICEEVLAKGRRRTFMVDRKDEPNETLDALVDRRVIHVVARNVLDAERPTRRFSLYTIDYGLYVDLLDRRYAMMPEFAKAKRTTSAEHGGDVIPLNTRRYLRGCVLKPEDFERGHDAGTGRGDAG